MGCQMCQKSIGYNNTLGCVNSVETEPRYITDLYHGARVDQSHIVYGCAALDTLGNHPTYKKLALGQLLVSH